LLSHFCGFVMHINMTYYRVIMFCMIKYPGDSDQQLLESTLFKLNKKVHTIFWWNFVGRVNNATRLSRIIYIIYRYNSGVYILYIHTCTHAHNDNMPHALINVFTGGMLHILCNLFNGGRRFWTRTRAHRMDCDGFFPALKWSSFSADG